MIDCKWQQIDTEYSCGTEQHEQRTEDIKPILETNRNSIKNPSIVKQYLEPELAALAKKSLKIVRELNQNSHSQNNLISQLSPTD